MAELTSATFEYINAEDFPSVNNDYPFRFIIDRRVDEVWDIENSPVVRTLEFAEDTLVLVPVTTMFGGYNYVPNYTLFMSLYPVMANATVPDTIYNRKSLSRPSIKALNPRPRASSEDYAFALMNIRSMYIHDRGGVHGASIVAGVKDPKDMVMSSVEFDWMFMEVASIAPFDDWAGNLSLDYKRSKLAITGQWMAHNPTAAVPENSAFPMIIIRVNYTKILPYPSRNLAAAVKGRYVK